MKKLKTVIKVLGYGVLGLCALLAAGWFIPFPIEGNWTGRTIGCMCDAHNFLRFEDGKILIMSDAHTPPEWVGAYRQKGRGYYEIEKYGSELFREDSSYTDAYSRLLRVKSDTNFLGRLIRDPFVLTCRRAINNPENEWIQNPHFPGYRITGTSDKRLFFVWGKDKKTREEIETALNSMLYRQTLQIYTSSNEVPASVIELLTRIGFDYQIHASQEWIAAEWINDPSQPKWRQGPPKYDPDVNPLWTNKIPRLIIRTPTEEDKEEDPEIYFGGGDAMNFEKVEKNFEFRWRLREFTKTNLYLYAENGILPEDVRQMFEPFGIEPRVLDEKILYRGKKR